MLVLSVLRRAATLTSITAYREYKSFGAGDFDYGNLDLAFRPRNPSIDYIVIHDTEGYWEGVLKLVQDPTYVSWQCSLRSADGQETDVTFVGPVGRPSTEEPPHFDADISGWLAAGQVRDAAWLVPDTESPDGVAVDLTAWRAAG